MPTENTPADVYQVVGEETSALLGDEPILPDKKIDDIPAPPGAWRILGRLILLILRLGLVAAFLYSSIAKLLDPQEFLFAVKAFEILPVQPDFLINFVTYTVPITELICGILLLFGFWSRAAGLMLSILLVVFTAAIFSVLARGLSIDCGCFGKWMPAHVTWLTPLRNLALFIPALLITIFGGGLLALDNRFSSRA